MEKERELIKNTSIIMIGKVCTQMVTFLLLPLYTSFLNTAEYGIVDLLTTLVSLALPVITLQMEQALFRKLIDCRNEKNDEDKVRYISTAFFSVIIQVIVFMILFFVISPLIKNEFKYYLAFNIGAYVFSAVFQQIARGLGDNKEYSIGSFLSALFTIILNVIFLVVFKLGAYGMIYGTIIGQLICSLYLFFRLRIFKYLKVKEYDIKILKIMLMYSLPLIPNTLSWWIFNASDRIIVSYILGVDQNGILAVAHKFSTIIVFLLNIYSMSWTESIASHVNDGDFEDFLNKMLNKSLRIFSALSLGIMICMPIAFPLLINRNFSDGYFQIPILLIATVFMVFISLVGAVYLAKNNTIAVAMTSFVSALINLTLNISMIHHIGLYAATLSTFLAYAIMSVFRYYDINKKYLKLILPKEFFVKTFLAFSICTILYYSNNLYSNASMFIVGIIYCIDINKEIIVYFINKVIKNK